MTTRINCLLFIVLYLSSCQQQTNQSPLKDQQLVNFVNPFIGTGGHGHTYPGAVLPFGMMQLSPDTRLDGWDGCSGYHYSDEHIYGFSHTHLSGTGVSDYGDILLMPTNEVNFHNGGDGNKGYRAPFSHANEKASPGYYAVHLDSTDINVELSTSMRSGIHKYIFPSSENQIIILDLEHRDELLSGKIERLSSTEIQGHRFSNAWAKEQKLYFYLTLSHPIKEGNSFWVQPKNGDKKVAIHLDNPNNEEVFIKIGISAVDIEGAKQNLEQEIGKKSFQQVKETAQNIWEKQLEKIVIESDNIDYKTNFYTSMYHVALAPNLYHDVDGRYRGMDLEIHETKDFDYYTVFSLWDTYRAAHPLYTIIEQERTNDFINTFIAKHNEGGIMPIWDLSANYTGCMIGYHAVPVIADAYIKGIRSYNADDALEAMIHSASQDQLGLASYKEYGYIPVEKESESVSKILEYAYDDWTIAQMAKAMNKEDRYKEFIQRAQFYKNSYDPKSQFMRGRFRNSWFSPFDPYEVNFNYTEANAWQYSYYVPQDVSGFISLLGGKEQLVQRLDAIFSAENETSGRDQADITGLIGQYAHGNEPSHHIAYLYNFVNQPYKTQEKVHEILTTLYTNTPDGISGNEDCGQMSAWYVFSSLGFYPVTPGSQDYIIGTPLFKKANIQLENGKSFSITANNLSDANKYIASAILNGKKLDRSYITHEEIMKGGELSFEMSDHATEWATQEGEAPVSEIKDYPIVPPPFIAKGEIAFTNETLVTLQSIDQESNIYYSFDGSEYSPYTTPISLNEAGELRIYSDRNGEKSPTISTFFFKIDPNLSVSLGTEYANQYNGGGPNALIDGTFGTEDFRTGTWQGYFDKDLIATVNKGKIEEMKEIKVNFLQDQRSWIFYPTEIKCSVSKDGKSFKTIGIEKIDASKASEDVQVKTITFQPNGSYKYVKIEAKKLGILPEWHLGYKHDGRSWLFVDEITIQ